MAAGMARPLLARPARCGFSRHSAVAEGRRAIRHRAGLPHQDDGCNSLWATRLIGYSLGVRYGPASNRRRDEILEAPEQSYRRCRWGGARAAVDRAPVVRAATRRVSYRLRSAAGNRRTAQNRRQISTRTVEDRQPVLAMPIRGVAIDWCDPLLAQALCRTGAGNDEARADSKRVSASSPRSMNGSLERQTGSSRRQNRLRGPSATAKEEVHLGDQAHGDTWRENVQLNVGESVRPERSSVPLREQPTPVHQRPDGDTVTSCGCVTMSWRSRHRSWDLVNQQAEPCSATARLRRDGDAQGAMTGKKAPLPCGRINAREKASSARRQIDPFIRSILALVICIAWQRFLCAPLSPA